MCVCVRFGDPSPVLPLRRLSSAMSQTLVRYAEEKEAKVVGLTASGAAFNRSLSSSSRMDDRSTVLGR